LDPLIVEIDSCLSSPKQTDREGKRTPVLFPTSFSKMPMSIGQTAVIVTLYLFIVFFLLFFDSG
jgi:hypothetical protein